MALCTPCIALIDADVPRLHEVFNALLCTVRWRNSNAGAGVMWVEAMLATGTVIQTGLEHQDPLKSAVATLAGN